MMITCPQCGADITIQPRSLQLICPFCETPLILKKEPLLESYKLEPTCEETPATLIAEQHLVEKSREEKIVKRELHYLPFYRFLSERNGKFVENVFSALSSPPFFLFSIPSGSIVTLKENDKDLLMKPEKSISEILESMKKQKTLCLDEMLLLHIPFWKITISSDEIIWIDAVQGKIHSSTVLEKQKRTGRFLKITLTTLLALLLIEGISVPQVALRLLLQFVTAGFFLFFIRKYFSDEY
ncbi:zinc ribbon domain-containing protein [candidate division WOR-3 bacterium]|nr:zinc ribbon domain-containing protein [candidate division WOR-3 bacterium]